MVRDVALNVGRKLLTRAPRGTSANQITISSRVFLFSSPCMERIDPSNGFHTIYVSVVWCYVAVGDSVVGHNCHVPTHITRPCDKGQDFLILESISMEYVSHWP